MCLFAFFCLKGSPQQKSCLAFLMRANGTEETGGQQESLNAVLKCSCLGKGILQMFITTCIHAHKHSVSLRVKE